MYKITKGSLVNTCYGKGKVIGFESFDSKGNTVMLDSIGTLSDRLQRVQVRLDNPENWILHIDSRDKNIKRDPFFCLYEIEVI